MAGKTLTVGKLRGLSSTSTQEGIFAILALDHRQALMKMIDPLSPDLVSYERVVALKKAFVGKLGDHVSAVLLDPIYGAAQLIGSGSLPGSTGLMVALEQSGYTGEATRRISQIQPGWSVQKAKRIGADAIKLLVYYHPDTGDVARYQENLVHQVVAECQKADIPLFLEVLTYSPDPEVDRESKIFSETLPQVILRIADQLGRLGPDVMKLEFPLNIKFDMDEGHWAKACRQITEAAPCPWTLLSAGVEFGLFCRQIEVACKSGASGYIAGRAVWREGIQLEGNLLFSWLDSIAVRRMKILSELAAYYGKSWQEYYEPIDIRDLKDWYIGYEG